MTIPNLPLIDKSIIEPVVAFALALTISLASASSSGIFNDKLFFFNATSKAGIFTDENIAKQFRGSIGGKRLSAATRTLDDLEVNYNTRLQQLRTEFPTLSLAQVKNKILEDDSFSITTPSGRITLYEQAKQEYLIEFENYTRAINTFSLESGRGLGVIQ